MLHKTLLLLHLTDLSGRAERVVQSGKACHTYHTCHLADLWRRAIAKAVLFQAQQSLFMLAKLANV